MPCFSTGMIILQVRSEKRRVMYFKMIICAWDIITHQYIVAILGGLLCKHSQIWSVQPHSGRDPAYSSIHGPLLSDLTLPVRQVSERVRGDGLPRPVPQWWAGLRHGFTTASFTKKAAVSKGIRPTWKGCVSSLLQRTNKGSRDPRGVQQWSNTPYCWKVNESELCWLDWHLPRSVQHPYIRHT